MIEEEIDAEMPNVVELIMIEKNDQSKLYRSTQCMCRKDNPDMGEEVKMEKSVEDMIPTRFHKCLSVFKKKELVCLPLHKPWDNVIKTKSEFQPKKSKVYGRVPGSATYTKLRVGQSDSIKLSLLHGSRDHKLLQGEGIKIIIYLHCMEVGTKVVK